MHTEDVESGYFVHPGEGTHAGVVLIHDVWGMGDHPRDLARRLAQEGFAVLALDVYRRVEDLEIENPGEWMRGLSDPDVLADVQTGVDFLSQHPATEGHRIGVIGFCMGGMYALLAGCGLRDVSAVTPFYGLLSHEHGILFSEEGLDPAKKPRQPLDAADHLACPLLGFFGDQDEFVPVSDIEELQRRARAAGQDADVVVYPGAGHAFLNDTRPDAYRPADAADAWSRMASFFHAKLD